MTINRKRFYSSEVEMLFILIFSRALKVNNKMSAKRTASSKGEGASQKAKKGSTRSLFQRLNSVIKVKEAFTIDSLDTLQQLFADATAIVTTKKGKTLIQFTFPSDVRRSVPVKFRSTKEEVLKGLKRTGNNNPLYRTLTVEGIDNNVELIGEAVMCMVTAIKDNVKLAEKFDSEGALSYLNLKFDEDNETMSLYQGLISLQDLETLDKYDDDQVLDVCLNLTSDVPDGKAPRLVANVSGFKPVA